MTDRRCAINFRPSQTNLLHKNLADLLNFSWPFMSEETKVNELCRRNSLFATSKKMAKKKFRRTAMWWYNDSEIICSKKWRTNSALYENSKSSGHEGYYWGLHTHYFRLYAFYKKQPGQADPITVLHICRHCLHFNGSQLREIFKEHFHWNTKAKNWLAL